MFLGLTKAMFLRPDLPTGRLAGGTEVKSAVPLGTAGAEPRAARLFAGEHGEHPPFDRSERASILIQVGGSLSCQPTRPANGLNQVIARRGQARIALGDRATLGASVETDRTHSQP